MSDSRALRDAVEKVQVELRLARAQLATPVDVEKITSEVNGKLTALGDERARLLEAIRGVDGLRARVEEVELRARLDRSSSWNLRATLEVAGVLALVGVFAWFGALAARMLPELATPAVIVVVGLVAYPLVFVDVASLAKWIRRARVHVGQPRPRSRLVRWFSVAGVFPAVGLGFGVRVPAAAELIARVSSPRPPLRWDRRPTADTISEAKYEQQQVIEAPLLEEVRQFLKFKDFGAAKARLLACIEERYRSVDCHLALGTYYAKTNQEEAGAAEYRLFLRYAPLSHPSYEQVAQMLENFDENSR